MRPGRIALFPLGVLLVIGSVAAVDELGFYRAIYGPWNYTHDAKVGLDADYDNTWWTFGGERILERFSRNSKDAAANNITYVAGLYYLGDHAKFDYVRAVHMTGSEQEQTPSPVDETYWSELIEKPALAVANLSLTHPIWGLVWDFELYLASDPWRTADYSYDQSAISAFAAEKLHEIPELAPSERHSWLRDSALLDDFHQWQEEKVYLMAKTTEERVHAINPALSLGILGFSDSWRYWITLEAFSTPSAPVTAWTEDTYGGYNEERIEYLRDLLDQHGLNGKVLPGLYTVVLSPWKMIEEMERAIRHNGAFWIYQHNGDQYRLADELAYSWAYQVFDRYVFFNSSRPNVLPRFEMYPGIEVRPYGGSDAVTVLLKRRMQISGPRDFQLLTDSSDLEYIGSNLSVKALGGTGLSTTDLPCIISGLSEADLIMNEAWSSLAELADLLDAFNALGFSPLESIEAALSQATGYYEAGRYEEAISTLRPNKDLAYDRVLEAIWPIVQDAMGSPRESPIPLASISRISTANRMYEEDRRPEGNEYLLSGLAGWALAVSELTLASAPLVSICIFLNRFSSAISRRS